MDLREKIRREFRGVVSGNRFILKRNKLPP